MRYHGGSAVAQEKVPMIKGFISRHTTPDIHDGKSLENGVTLDKTLIATITAFP
jgi:hypothetical protein